MFILGPTNNDSHLWHEVEHDRTGKDKYYDICDTYVTSDSSTIINVYTCIQMWLRFVKDIPLFGPIVNKGVNKFRNLFIILIIKSVKLCLNS